jgi:hypothetical protein
MPSLDNYVQLLAFYLQSINIDCILLNPSSDIYELQVGVENIDLAKTKVYHLVLFKQKVKELEFYIEAFENTLISEGTSKVFFEFRSSGDRIEKAINRKYKDKVDENFAEILSLLIKNRRSDKMLYKEKYITDEMKKYSDVRTKFHIDLVRKYLSSILTNNLTEDIFELKDKAKNHDHTKFQKDLYLPYVVINWNYKLRKDTGKDWEHFDEFKIETTEATEKHVKSEPHHPEFHTDQTNVINSENRDKAKVLIDATKMPDLDILEMCADWCAVSEERKTCPFDWARNNINKRWQFTVRQERLIYNTLNSIWGQNNDVA